MADTSDRAASWPPRIRRGSLRRRWFVAITILGGATALLAAAAVVALRDTGRQLASYNEQVLPDVAKSLELAERVSHLAATAPYVAEAAIASKLNQESAELKKLQAEVDRQAGSPSLRTQTSDLAPVLSALQSSIDELIQVKREDLFLREDLRAQLFVLDELAAQARGARPACPVSVELASRTAQLAAGAVSAAEVEQLREEFAASLGRSAGVRGARCGTGRLAATAAAIFKLRLSVLAQEDRKAYLLAYTRVLSDAVTTSVDRHVARIERELSERQAAIRLAIRTGTTGIAIVSAVALVVLLGTAFVVRRSLAQLDSVTSAMTSLAARDAHGPPPEAAGHDEVAQLIAAFDVFRDNALAMRGMAASLSEQTRLLETVFDSINDGLSVFDRDRRLVAWNPRYLELLELPASAVRAGSRLEDIQALLQLQAKPAADAPGSALGEWNARRARSPHSLEATLPSGRVLSLRSQPMPDGGFVTLYSDLTERRAVDAQLRQSQKMEVLGQLTGGVAHDFNNLLAAIMSNLQLLEAEASLSPAVQRIVGRAAKASERAASLTRRMLAFARRQPLSPEPVDVDAVIAELRDLVKHSAGHAIRIEMSHGAGGALVSIDRGQLENALLNLTLNAGAAMPDGGQLRFVTRLVDAGARVHPAGAAVEIEVADTGVGMSDAVRERIFEPFFTTKRSEGSGLGLSIVYGFVKQSGGDIRVASRPGAGTSFTILLPVLAEAGARPHAPASPSSQVPPGLRILLVEDDDDVRPALVDVLQRLQAEVLAARSRPEAVEALRAHAVDLVLSDVGLGPQGDGLSLRTWVLEHCPGTPVVVMSGLPSDLLAQRYEGSTRVPILRKPFTADELAAAVSAALEAASDA
jgi:signal transduction histidine kinase/ActR/RegA family two-component response regulator/HAMP domain-containing protein